MLSEAPRDELVQNGLTPSGKRGRGPALRAPRQRHTPALPGSGTNASGGHPTHTHAVGQAGLGPRAQRSAQAERCWEGAPSDAVAWGEGLRQPLQPTAERGGSGSGGSGSGGSGSDAD